MNEQKKESPSIGQLRKDLQIFRADDNLSSGESSWTIFDPVNGQYYIIDIRD